MNTSNKEQKVVQTVFRAGNSLVVAVPAKFRNNLGIQPGDPVRVKCDSRKQSVTYEFPSSRQLSLMGKK